MVRTCQVKQKVSCFAKIRIILQFTIILEGKYAFSCEEEARTCMRNEFLPYTNTKGGWRG